MPYRSRELNANLTKGAANLSDILAILKLWDPEEESPPQFRERAVEGNLLAKTSRSRTADLLDRVFLRRYVANRTGQPAKRLRRLIMAGVSRDAVDRILYYHAALAEHLLYRCVAELLYDHRTRGVEQLSKRDVLRYLRELEEEGSFVRSYSESVTDKLAQSLLAALRDFRVLEGKAKKRLAPVQVPAEVIGYVAYALSEEVRSANRIIRHDDWRLYLLHPREVEERMIDVAGFGYFDYHAAGDIRRFDWAYSSLDEYVTALAGE